MKVFRRYEPIKETLSEREQKMNSIIVKFCLAFAVVSLIYIIRFYASHFYTPADGIYYYQGVIEIISLILFLSCVILTSTIGKKHPVFPRYYLLLIYLFKAVVCGLWMEGNYLIFFIIPIIFAIGFYDVNFSIITAVSIFLSFVISDTLSAYIGIVDLNCYDVAFKDGLTFIFDDTKYAANLIVTQTVPIGAMLFVVCLLSVILAKNGADTLLKEYNISKEKTAMEKEFSLGKEIQQSMLPERVLITPNYSAFSYMISAKNVGGDFLDYFIIGEDKLLITIGDVSGKGISASLFASNTKALIRAYALSGCEPALILQQSNISLCSTNKKKLFVTIWLGLVDLKTGDCTYCNAGHNPPIIKSKDGNTEWLKTKPNFVLGRRPHIVYDQHHFKLNIGDSLVLYTDGVTEAMDEQGQLYGEERLMEFVTNNSIDETFTKRVMRSIVHYRGKAEQNDDISLVCARLTELKEGKDFERTFKASREEYYDLCEFVLDFAGKYTEDKKIFNDIEVSLGEIFSNLEFYSAKDKKKPTDVKVSLAYDDGLMTIVFADNGIAFNPLDRPKPSAAENKKNKVLGGFGIFMVKNLMDDVTYRYEDMNILTLKKRLN